MRGLQLGMDFIADVLCHPASLLAVALVFLVVVASDIVKTSGQE
jgi:hypothetical protein